MLEKQHNLGAHNEPLGSWFVYHPWAPHPGIKFSLKKYDKLNGVHRADSRLEGYLKPVPWWRKWAPAAYVRLQEAQGQSCYPTNKDLNPLRDPHLFHWEVFSNFLSQVFLTEDSVSECLSSRGLSVSQSSLCLSRLFDSPSTHLSQTPSSVSTWTKLPLAQNHKRVTDQLFEPMLSYVDQLKWVK